MLGHTGRVRAASAAGGPCLPPGSSGQQVGSRAAGRAPSCGTQRQAGTATKSRAAGARAPAPYSAAHGQESILLICPTPESPLGAQRLPAAKKFGRSRWARAEMPPQFSVVAPHPCTCWSHPHTGQGWCHFQQHFPEQTWFVYRENLCLAFALCTALLSTPWNTAAPKMGRPLKAPHCLLALQMTAQHGLCLGGLQASKGAAGPKDKLCCSTRTPPSQTW